MPRIEHAIDLSDIEISSTEPGSFECLPPGKYRVLIARADYKKTASGNGMRIPLELSIVGGDFAGRTLFEGLNVDNPNETAQLIGRQRLKEILEAIGLDHEKFSDTDQIEGEIVVAHVTRNLVKDLVQREKYGDRNGMQNSVSRFSPASPQKNGAARAPVATEEIVHDDNPFD
jgi:hypothetical protein